MKQWLRTLHRNEYGMAALEFAMMSPILVSMLLGTVEMSRFILIQQRTDKIATTIADVISQSESLTLTDAQVTQILSSTTELMSPYTFGSSGRVIVSSIGKTGTAAPTVLWQRNGGGLSQTSKIGSQGGAATMPTGFTMVDKDNVIVTEVYYNYTTLFGSRIIGSSLIYKNAFYKPRLGALTTAPS